MAYLLVATFFRDRKGYRQMVYDRLLAQLAACMLPWLEIVATTD
jgi:hypothetical protein